VLLSDRQKCSTPDPFQTQEKERKELLFSGLVPGCATVAEREGRGGRVHRIEHVSTRSQSGTQKCAHGFKLAYK